MVDRVAPGAGYAQLLYGNYDYWEETHDVTLDHVLLDRLETAKNTAHETDKRGNTVGSIDIAGDVYQVRPYGLRGGNLWIFENDDLMFKIRSPELPYHVSVRFTAAGLAEHGVQDLHDRVDAFFDGFAKPAEHPPRVSRVDWCYDVFSPAFTEEMVPAITERFVVPSGVKARDDGGSIFGVPGRVETLTIGTHKSPLSVQVYDKGREIREASGKEWMRELWGRYSPWEPPPLGEPIEHVWRIEVRARRDWLKHRRLDTLEDFNEGGISALLTEALMTRRLTVPNGDQNRARWPLAPLWTLLLDQHPADHMRPLGRRFTMRGSQIASMCIDNAVGNLRTAGYLLDDDDDAVFEEAQLRRDQDKQYELKLRRTAKRYAGVNDAR